MENPAFEKWARAYKSYSKNNTELLFPSETLIRVFKGNYVPGMDKSFSGKKVLDIGCGNGNNMLFLGSLGLDLYGTEVHEDICRQTEARLSKLGYKAKIKIGTNVSLPYPDNTFDFIVSWNVLHYEDSEQGILEALSEYKRVMKPGGRFFISTTGPEHKILKSSKTLGNHRYRIGRSDDFRKGQVYFYFDAQNYIKHYFGKYFKKVLVGRTHDFLFTECLDWFIVTGIK